MSKLRTATNFIFILFLIPFTIVIADEGMWPITEIQRLKLQSKGLEIPVNEIFNPDDLSLVNGIVNLSGCTASFVSADGLVLTNHHCAFGAVQRASTKENDYLSNGFLATKRKDEIYAPGTTASIIETYRDVSEEVLNAVNNEMTNIERTKSINKRKKEIILAAEKEFPGKRAVVAEMFIGKTYYLFIYTRFNDVRLVYVPPQSIGNFGGETDNWIWPRHTGDFSFFRVYVAPDGSPAEYSENNVPYHPKKYFQVSSEGVNEEDFVFILGYPGKTYRHRTSSYMAYEQEIGMPYIVDLYDWQISTLEDFSKEDRSIALKLSSRIKGLSNRTKNYKGKLTGMNRLNLVEQKRKLEQQLQSYIESDSGKKEKYGTILNEIEKIYSEKRKYSQRDLLTYNMIRGTQLLRSVNTVLEAAENRVKPDIERESSYMDRNFKRTVRYLIRGQKSFHESADKIFLKEFLNRAMQLPDALRIEAIDNIISKENQEKNINNFIEKLYSTTKFTDSKFVKEAIEKTEDELKEIDDPALQFILNLKPVIEERKNQSKKHSGALSKLHGKLIDIKKEFSGKNFVPDANGSLRLTYGYIRGYAPADAVHYNPITTFKGVAEKTTGINPFTTPEGLLSLYRKKDFGQFKNKKLNDVPVCILYNTDTTGGNSGSPVLNAKGELIGVNFDRAWEATINDFAWSEDYSRSIAVDIRYVLWVTQKFAGADFLLEEMNVPQLIKIII